MTFDELVEKYRKRLNEAPNKRNELEKIIREINGLTYKDSGKPISQEKKTQLLEELRKQAISESQAHFAQDNSEFLELMDVAIKALRGK